MKKCIRIERVGFYCAPFEMQIDVRDGESVDDAIDRAWENGSIPGQAEARVRADDLVKVKVLGEEAT